MWARNDVDGDKLADLFSSARAGFNSGLHSSDVAADDRGDIATADALIADEFDASSFHHRIRSLNEADKSFSFDHSKSFRHFSLLLLRSPFGRKIIYFQHQSN